jgi:geranylgeranyl diphosphate synthase, type I
MFTPAELDVRLEGLSAELDAWTRDFFERHRPTSGRFAGLLSYPLGWVDPELRPVDPPAPAGKRLRPAVCLLACEAVCGDYRPALAAAAAVELIHNFSLVHDDIQDESPLRRGRPTVWARWQTAHAINVGDSLFALAQLALLEAAPDRSEMLVEAARQLNLTCLRLVEGQSLDLDLQSAGSASLKDYQTMVAGKTAALLEAAAWLGARFGGADEDRARRLAAFGHHLGLAFQFQDDLLGVWGDPSLTGKPADTDLRARKQALPVVLALQSSDPTVERFREVFLAPDNLTAEQAQAARLMLDSLGVRERAELMVEEGYARAEDALNEALGEGFDSALLVLLGHFRGRAA